MPSKIELSGATPRRRTAKKKTTTVVSVSPVVDDEVIERQIDAGPAPRTGLFRRGSVKHHEITTFLRQLIMLLDAGTPILKALRTLSQRGENPALRALVSDITQYVEAGNPLWQCFDRHPRYFDEVFVNLVKASEASGTLITVLRRVADYREGRQLLTKRVRNAMAYPVVLVVACTGVLLLLTKLVIPEFEQMFERQGIVIPPATHYFLQGAHIFGNWWWLPFVAFFVFWLVYRYWFLRSELRRLWADRIKLHIPILGKIVHKNAIVEMSQTMALLLRSGLSMMATLNLTRKAIHNRAVAESLQGVRDSVEQGGGLEAPLRAASDVIPHVVTDMFVTGEESGRVDQVAEQIATVYEEEVKIAVAGLGEMLQPVFTVIVGLVVMALFASLFYPIVSMIESISSASGG
jgi:type II secretory pathway component PulF